MIKNLIWYGPPYSYSGYATHNRFMLFELLKHSWNISLFPTESHIPEHLHRRQDLINLSKNNHLDPDQCLSVNLIPPPAVPLFGKYTILYTTLESDTVHEGYLRRCSQFDEVWVPCKYNFKSMKKAGFPKEKLFLCPEGVDTDLWTPWKPPLPKYWSRKFTFFFNGDWSFRKGIDMLISAYCKTFMSTDDVRLLLLTHYQGMSGPEAEKRILQEFDELLDKNHVYKHPEITFINEYIPDNKLNEVYNCADIGVFPTRGEAWGLPLIQLMSCAKPVITTNAGGQCEFCNKDNSYLIDVENYDIFDDKTELCVDFYKEQLFPFPSETHLGDIMRYCYNNRGEVKRRGEIAREHVRKHFTWHHAGIVANHRLEKILKEKFR